MSARLINAGPISTGTLIAPPQRSRLHRRPLACGDGHPIIPLQAWLQERMAVIRRATFVTLVFAARPSAQQSASHLGQEITELRKRRFQIVASSHNIDERTTDYHTVGVGSDFSRLFGG